ncbi:MAG: sorbosone dehydrogenase family protein [Chitinophagaceae bacterium]|nr:MAG: sorbosone dehydrogenase family protein [Chitinophagaceae bacterium]
MKIILSVCLLAATLSACSNKKAGKQTVSIDADTAALYKKYNLDKIKLPAGFSISVYAEVPNARSITLSPSGVLYVGNRSEENVYAVVDEDKNGKADKVYTVASGLNTPNGVAFKNGNLYIATISEILKLEGIEAKLNAPPAPVSVYNKFPADKHHGWKFIAFGPDGKLYVPVGAPCNICEQKDSVYSTITRMNDDGTGFEIYANGIRNSVGFAWHPASRHLWFTENGRDMMGDDMPGDELNTAPTPGMHFGFPYCHQGNTPDPEFGKGKSCDDYTPPVQILDAHVAALGMRFYTGTMFPETYKNQILFAEHGSWNRSQPSGYKLSMVKLDENGKSLGRTDFATGWLQPGGKVLGRPVDVEIMPDGSLLVSDDYSGVIYRIVYSG